MASGRRTRPAAGGTGHAVVLGAGMAGLSVAAALTQGFERVTVLERDTLPAGVGSRTGTPQDRHLHLLLPSGAAGLEEVLPGVRDDLMAAGAVPYDTNNLRAVLGGHRLVPAPMGQAGFVGSRPLVEAQVRRRVRDIASVSVREGRAVRGLVLSDDGRTVAGVRLADADGAEGEATLACELVVDGTGRGSRTDRWLADAGYRPAPVEELQVDVRYATRAFDLPDDVLGGDVHVLIGPTPDDPRGGAMTRIGTDRWLVTLFAMAGAQPPKDRAAFEKFAGELAVDDLAAAVTGATEVGDAASYRFPANRRRRYEDLAELPDGLLVAGDAVCSFNPIYGQGMSVAALQAAELARLLRADGSPPAPRDWFGAIAPTVDAAWQMATGADLAVRDVAGRRGPAVRATGAYLARLQAGAAHDPVLSRRFVRAASLLDPPQALLRPSTAARVARAVLRGRVRPVTHHPRRTARSGSGRPGGG